MNKELKNCPFCGGEAVTYSERLDYEGNLLYGVMCKNTGCCMIPAVYMAKEIAVQKWNTRKPIKEAVQLLEAYKAVHLDRYGKADNRNEMNLEKGRYMAYNHAVIVVKRCTEEVTE